MAYVETGRVQFRQALERESFSLVACLEQQYRLEGGQLVDLAIYRRDRPAVARE
jgi:hypothetical protein